MASGTIFTKMLGVGMTKREKQSSQRGWRSLWGGYEAAPFSCVIEWTLLSFHDWGIASRSAQAIPLGSR